MTKRDCVVVFSGVKVCFQNYSGLSVSKLGGTAVVGWLRRANGTKLIQLRTTLISVKQWNKAFSLSCFLSLVLLLVRANPRGGDDAQCKRRATAAMVVLKREVKWANEKCKARRVELVALDLTKVWKKERQKERSVRKIRKMRIKGHGWRSSFAYIINKVV